MEGTWKNFHDCYKVLQTKIVATAVKFCLSNPKEWIFCFPIIEMIFKRFLRRKICILFLEEKYAFRAEELLNASVILWNKKPVLTGCVWYLSGVLVLQLFGKLINTKCPKRLNTTYFVITRCSKVDAFLLDRMTPTRS